LANEIVYWDGAPISNFERIEANNSIILFLFFFIGSYFFIKPSTKYFSFQKVISYQDKLPQISSLISLSILIGIFCIYLYNWDIRSFFIRGGDRTFLDLESQPLRLIIDFFLRPLAFNIGVYLFYFSKKKRVISIFSFIFGIILCFPTAIPRSLAATLYIPFILISFMHNKDGSNNKSIQSKYLLPNVLFFAVLLIFPLLDLFRNFRSIDSLDFKVLNFNTIFAGHFDAYQMLIRALSFDHYFYGYGFFGTLFFWIPRSIWPGKPFDSAQIVAGFSGLSHENVSMPLIAEFFLNFGYLGVVIGAIILGIFLRYIDSIFLKGFLGGLTLTRSAIIYFQLIGILFLILRGGLLSSFAYGASILLTWLFIWVCQVIFNNSKYHIRP
jgi:oligosaccharide repeat unit polymerase